MVVGRIFQLRQISHDTGPRLPVIVVTDAIPSLNWWAKFFCCVKALTFSSSDALIHKLFAWPF